MKTLHLGVVDVPYVNDEDHTIEPVRKGKRRGRNKGSRWRRSDLIGGSVTTTGDVAQILEDKYHIMEVFFEEKVDTVIAPALAESMAGALETVLMGGPPPADPLAPAFQSIETSFKAFLTNREMESLGYPGVPTEAAKKGVNHRMKHPYAERDSRPSFIDTGLYEASFKAWGDDG